MNPASGLALALATSLLVSAGIPGNAFAESYEYDAVGRISRVVYDTGQVVDYFYDLNSNITSIVTTGQIAANPGPGEHVPETVLGAVHPNPASGSARLRFSLAEDGEVVLRFFDVAGRLVQEIDREYGAGEYEVQVNVGQWAAGVYFYRLEIGDFRATRRMIVLN